MHAIMMSVNAEKAFGTNNSKEQISECRRTWLLLGSEICPGLETMSKTHTLTFQKT